ncbi:2Fe-2S iron-sulfur cluster-binding protein [Pseudomonas chlororaphis]|uniref:2Fe-2S iron-sulfur cluster-binding protein n=1 Tax=Pseudomonas chlororaphis TaxID=587753 RepID=UPI0007B3343B|nr:2Fe-2S iron-sulfur cluster-binding protein [Pseudomonas chlororaphis]AZC50306.1 Periplasmic aromatic aldehyde oxidoreductase, iron-sulfur subunit YagT [Pseudomonas chlororaphis subsp. piscium]AZC56882.1 Periplasmic aromatic aldehyde oxidoreductase, iron-sulfur subunit YagT [Pseudomonas chlororaphis subsp. piscium]AZC63109.1 Periplasmic aromatic aldehyde oxidoreductase, iron-sulfur subunit YagT [Pseudomonas chlororaphis subsp. piscium]AZC69340.1 Periplasmic aromatic aldehyde oxidoreductase, i
MEDLDSPRPSRRALLQAGAAASLLWVGGGRAQLQSQPPSAPALSSPAHPLPSQAISLRINASDQLLDLDPRTTLLDALRHQLGMTGSKKGCDHGQCGACTVLVNGRRINACLSLAVMHDGDEITTIEGLANGDLLHPLQAAFIARDAFQCGYCTPGQICSAVGMLQEVRAGWPSHVTDDLVTQSVALSDAEIRERMSGNLCRCAAYPNIVAAIRDAAEEA